MLKADLHVHTDRSPDSLITPAKLVERCLAQGINCLAVTDHNSIEGAITVQRIAPFPVIVSEEIKTNQGEIIGLFLQETISPLLSAEETVSKIREQGGLVCLPHPFDRVRREPLRDDARESILSDIDIVEVFNARVTFTSDNVKARRFAEGAGLAMSAGSDAHSLWETGRAYVEMPEFETPQQFLEALRQGSIRGHRSLPLVHLFSAWAKLRRGTRANR
jgi:predicted metal-dependent phosphoesterase TrpH